MAGYLAGTGCLLLRRVITGEPDRKHISTSYAERRYWLVAPDYAVRERQTVCK
jgi:hypothetical protein